MDFFFFFSVCRAGEFPALQTRMRAVLRVEVEAVKFLKEEPHKLDSMLKRVKSLTDTLSSLRRYEGQSASALMRSGRCSVMYEIALFFFILMVPPEPLDPH